MVKKKRKIRVLVMRCVFKWIENVSNHPNKAVLHK